MKKRVCSMLLVLCMVLSLVPLAAEAAQSDETILECEPTLIGVLSLLHQGLSGAEDDAGEAERHAD